MTNPPIKFQISEIDTFQFAILKQDFEEANLLFDVAFTFNVDAESNLLRSTCEYTLSSGTSNLLKIEGAVVFALEKECFLEQIIHDVKFIIPQEFAIHMAMTTLNVTRGILHEKTKGSQLNRFTVPSVNLMELVPGDIELDKIIEDEKIVK